MNNKHKFHFVGIKGSGMSSLAQILHDMNNDVKGSDIEKEFFTEIPLRRKGINITNFDEKNINADETVIITRAFNESNPEVQKAFELGVGQYYYDFLGNFIDTFEISLAVSGSHGKTTTTGLASHVLSQLEKTSFLIGDGTGKGEVDSKYFVFEACEYKNHFHAYKPKYAIVTNIDFDHPDFFESKEDVVRSFQKFAQNVQNAVVFFGDQEETQKLQVQQGVTRWSYGFNSNNNLFAKNIERLQNGTRFDVSTENGVLTSVFIPMIGNHHILNTLAVCSVLYLEGYDLVDVAPLFSTFPGVKRRFNETVIEDVVVVDDYAHHPTEIQATLQTVRLKYPNKKAVVLFQPHTYSRTKALFDGFVESLKGFDEVYVADIFGSAREKVDTVGISSEKMIEEMNHSKAFKVGEHLPSDFFAYKDAVVLFMGAGDVTKYKDEYLRKIVG